MAISNNNCWLESSLQWNKEYKYRMIAIEAEAVYECEIWGTRTSSSKKIDYSIFDFQTKNPVVGYKVHSRNKIVL